MTKITTNSGFILRNGIVLIVGGLLLLVSAISKPMSPSSFPYADALEQLEEAGQRPALLQAEEDPLLANGSRPSYRQVGLSVLLSPLPRNCFGRWRNGSLWRQRTACGTFLFLPVLLTFNALWLFQGSGATPTPGMMPTESPIMLLANLTG